MLVSDEERLRNAHCWVRDTFGRPPTLPELTGGHFMLQENRALLDLIKPGSLLVQTPARAARNSRQTHMASRAQQGNHLALSAFTDVVVSPPTRWSFGRASTAERDRWHLGCLLILYVGRAPTARGITVVAFHLARRTEGSRSWSSQDAASSPHHIVSGGPCHGERPLAALVVDASQADVQPLWDATAFVPVPFDNSGDGATALLVGEPSAIATAAASPATPSQAAFGIEGVAVWSLPQLLDEFARGRWGVCHAKGGDWEAPCELDLWRTCWSDRKPVVAEEWPRAELW